MACARIQPTCRNRSGFGRGGLADSERLFTEPVRAAAAGEPGADKRAVALALTTAGRREAKRMQTARERMLQRVVSRLDDDERVVFEDLLIKILWHETRDPAHAMQLCRLCDDGPCLAAGCPVECREQGLPMPERSGS